MTTLHQSNISNIQEENAAKRVTEAEYWEKYYEYPDVVYEWLLRGETRVGLFNHFNV